MPEIRKLGDPCLRSTAVPASDSDVDLHALAAVLFETMRSAPGVGLAAPQIGSTVRMFVAEDGPELWGDLPEEILVERERVELAPIAVVDPVLRPVGEETVTFFEACLSVDGVAGAVRRHREVLLLGSTPSGDPVSLPLRGWPARIVQHEIDHLDGLLFIDKIVPRSRCSMDEFRARWRAAPIVDAARQLGFEV